jgi:hypothetical protein
MVIGTDYRKVWCTPLLFYVQCVKVPSALTLVEI